MKKLGSCLLASSALAIAGLSSATANAQEELRIGVIGNMTGVFAAFGETMVEGVEMAVAEADGTAGDYDIELSVVDDEGDPEIAITRLERLRTDEEVDVIIGPVSGNIGVAANDWAGENGMPMVVAYSAPEDITMRDRNHNVVRAGWTGAQPMFALGEYAAEQGWTDIVMVGQDYSFPHNQIGGFLKTFCRSGGENVERIWHPVGSDDFSSILATLPDADAVIYNGAGTDGVSFFSQYIEFGHGDTPLMGGSNFYAPGMLPAMGEETVGGISALQYSEELDTPEHREFRETYEEMFDRVPMATSEHGYVAAKMVIDAVEAIDSKEREPMIDELRATEMPDAPRGPFHLDEYANPVQNIYINEVQKVDGELRNVPIQTYESVSQFGPYEPEEYLESEPDSRDFPPGDCSDEYYS